MAISRRDVLKRNAALGVVSGGLAAPALAQAPATLTVMTYESLAATQRARQGGAEAGDAVRRACPAGGALRAEAASMLQSGIAPEVVMLDLEDALLDSRNDLP